MPNRDILRNLEAIAEAMAGELSDYQDFKDLSPVRAQKFLRMREDVKKVRREIVLAKLMETVLELAAGRSSVGDLQAALAAYYEATLKLAR